MPIYKVRGPDGKIHKFKGPDGATPEQVTSFAAQHFGQPTPALQTQSDPYGGFFNAIDQGIQNRAPTIARQGFQGLTGGFGDEGTDALGALFATAFQEPSALFSGEVTDPNLIDSLVGQRQNTLNTLQGDLENYPATSIASQIGGGAITSGAALTTGPGQAFARILGGSSLPVKSALLGGAGLASGGIYGMGAGEGSISERFDQGKSTALTSGAISAALPLAGAAASSLAPKIDDATKALAKRAQEFGIPIRLSEVSNSKPLKILAGVSDTLPFSGNDDYAAGVQKSFNREVAKTIGAEADSLDPVVFREARVNLNKQFENLLKGTKVEVDRDILSQIDSVVAEADDVLTEDVAKIVRKNADKLFSEIGNQDKISGEKLASFRSSLVKKIPKADSQARSFLNEIASLVDESVKGGLSTEEKAAYNLARMQWRNLKTIEPLLDKSANGDIPIRKLLNAVGSSKYFNPAETAVGQDDLLDIARIGNQLFKEFQSSGTTERALYGAGLIGAPIDFLTTGGAGTAATLTGLAAGRGVGALNRNQALVSKAIQPRSPIFLPKPSAAQIGLLSGSVQR